MSGGHEPVVAHGVSGYPELFEAAYRRVAARGAVSQRSDGAMLEIAHDGFARLGDGIMMNRSIRLQAAQLEIVDSVGGAGRHRLDTYFTFAPDVSVEHAGGPHWEITVPRAGRLLLEAPGLGVAAKGVGGKNAAGWHSRAYGRLEPAVRLSFSQQHILPATARYLFRPLEGAPSASPAG